MEHSLVGRQMSLLAPNICDIANSYRRQWANTVHSVMQRHMKDTDLFHGGFFLEKWKMSTIYCTVYTFYEHGTQTEGFLGNWCPSLHTMFLYLLWNQHILPYLLTKNILFSHKSTFNFSLEFILYDQLLLLPFYAIQIFTFLFSVYTLFGASDSACVSQRRCGRLHPFQQKDHQGIIFILWLHM